MREASREFKEVQNRCTRMNSMVSTLLKQGPVDDATEHHARAALAAASEHEVEEMNPLHLLSAQRNLMVVLAGKAQHADAIEVGEKVLSGYRSLLGPKHPTTVAVVRELSVIVLEGGDIHGAEPLLRDAWQATVALYGPLHEESLSSGMLLGQLLASQNKLDEAKALFRSNLRTSRKLHGDSHPLTLLVSSNLCALLMERGEYMEAEALLTWHVRLATRLHGQSSPQVREVAFRLAECRRAVHGDDLNERLGGVLGQVGGLGDIEDLGRIGECGKACASCEKQATCG